MMYFYRKIGYNISENNIKGMYCMDAAVKDVKIDNEQTAMATLVSYLDKGIDDMEAGRVHTVEDAFQIVRERMDNEL